MAKILVAEDDNSLREIYGTRLLAEGYDIVSAPDGEAALQMAVKEKPDLILSDVMMPRISGFEMIDILRSQDETRNIKVIVMTALSTDGQREKGESLGVDRYLVKSQVGIEDVVAAVHEVLGDAGATIASTANDPSESVVSEAAAQPTTPEPTAPVEPIAVEPAVVSPEVAANPAPNIVPSTDPVEAGTISAVETDVQPEEELSPTLSFDNEILAEAVSEPMPVQELAPASDPATAPEVAPVVESANETSTEGAEIFDEVPPPAASY
jgi:CheY-like chemotaxis protein